MISVPDAGAPTTMHAPLADSCSAMRVAMCASHEGDTCFKADRQLSDASVVVSVVVGVLLSGLLMVGLCEKASESTRW